MCGCVCAYTCEREKRRRLPGHVGTDKKLCNSNEEYSDCTSNQGKPSFTIWIFRSRNYLLVTKQVKSRFPMKRKRPTIESALETLSSWVMTTTSLGRIATSTWVRLRAETSPSRYNEVKKLCLEDQAAWFQCLEIVLLPRPIPSTEHFVRRSVRRVVRDPGFESPAGPLKGILFRDRL